MRRIFTFFLTFLLGVFVTALYAQTHTVSGTVIDKDANEPLIGANVLIKGTTIGTVTDLDGKYTLQAGDKDILVFSYLTYIIHSGFISGYQNRYGDNLKPPTNVYHRMTA